MNKVIHQIWGLCPADAGKDPPESLEAKSKTWKLPGFTYVRWNRKTIEDLLDSTPWRSAFDSLGHWVEQCDFARYVIVYIYGGIYADMDTTCQQSFSANPGELLVGLEADVSPAEQRFHGLARSKQICQWTFAAESKHPALFALIEHIAKVSSKQCIVDKSTSTIMNTTGPGIFTDVILSFQPTKEHSIRILGIDAFGCGQVHSGSPKCDTSTVLVAHHFEGSWKTPTFFRPWYKLLKRL
jgi:mannosyltransferase OCH1-like enzyme